MDMSEASFVASTFLTGDEVAILTGRKLRSKQIEALRKMALPFWVNARGQAVVPRSAIEGRATTAAPRRKPWVMPE